MVQVPSNTPFDEWLDRRGRFMGDTGQIIAGLGRAMIASGAPVDRLVYVRRTLHPLTSAVAINWRADRDGVEINKRSHDALSKSPYLNSPIHAIFTSGEELRRRLTGPNVRLDFPILEELVEAGVTDYLALPVMYSDGQVNAMTISTKAEGGFEDDILICLRRAAARIAPVLEVQSVRETASVVAQTYLGREAGARVLSGAITRGHFDEIRAVIWAADMREFTALSNTLPTEALMALINEFHTALVEPLHEAGGEVLKFIGDGLLGILPLDRTDGVAGAADAAVTAARAADMRVGEMNKTRVAAGEEAVDFGLALHLGSVAFGNIGAPDRMDFTVMGPAVNLASRVETLCAELGRRPLVTAAFAAAWGGETEDLGEFVLKGMKMPQRVFALKG